MENYQMRRGCGRPYNTTCGMGNQRELPCARRTITGTPTASGKEMYTHVDHMEPAMAYVPCQNFAMTYDLSYALKAVSYTHLDVYKRQWLYRVYSEG